MPLFSVKNSDQNPPEIQGREEDYRVPADAARALPAHTPIHPDSGKMVFIGDSQYSVTVRRGPVQSRIFDQKIGVSVRPQALILAAGLVQREAESVIEDPAGEFAGYYTYNMGDVMDSSNAPEWALFLNAGDETVDTDGVLAGNGETDWTKVDAWSDLYIKTLTEIAALPPVIEGNHDGAYMGNGLNHVVDPTDLRVKIIRYKRREAALTAKIEKLDRKISKYGEKSSRAASLRENRDELVSQREEVRGNIAKLEQALKDYKSEREEIPGEEKLVPGWLQNLVLNAIFGIPRGRTLFDPEGYAAQNAGGAANIVDKKKFIQLYLAARYKDLDLDPDTLQPLAAELRIFDESTGNYRTDDSPFSNIYDTQPEGVERNFNNFWREVRPGEYVCLFAYPGRAHASTNKKYILLQAIDQGFDANGIRQFHFLLDGMDSTEQNVPTAFFGVMSKWQRRLCQFFIDYQRLRYPEKGCWFYHSSHFPLRDLAKGHWKENGWLAYFQQHDVTPFVFSAHRHKRALIDATRPEFLGFRVPFGSPSIKREKAYSIVAPSQTDNLEFMSAETLYDDDSEKMSLTVRYHEIVPSDETEIAHRFDPDVIAVVDRLKDYYVQNRYREASEMRHDFFTSAYNVFFTDQSRIVAFDAIPISIYQFDETLAYAKAYLEFLALDFGPDDPFTRRIAAIYAALMRHRDLWMEGDPEADNPWDKQGYLTARAEAAKLRKKSEAAALLVHYNDIFDTPVYDLLRHLISETPRTETAHKAYDFWLLLARRARDEEAKPASDKKHRKGRETGIPDEVALEFDLPR